MGVSKGACCAHLRSGTVVGQLVGRQNHFLNDLNLFVAMLFPFWFCLEAMTFWCACVAANQEMARGRRGRNRSVKKRKSPVSDLLAPWSCSRPDEVCCVKFTRFMELLAWFIVLSFRYMARFTYPHIVSRCEIVRML